MDNTILKLGLFIVTLFTIDYLMTNNQKTYISHSKINGKGLFASKGFKKGDIIIENLFKNKPKNEVLYNPISYDNFQKYITIEGKYINHCNKQINSKVVSKDNKLYKLIATKNIQKDDEITANYNQINKRFPFIAKEEKGYVKC